MVKVMKRTARPDTIQEVMNGEFDFFYISGLPFGILYFEKIKIL
jgi:hypothetical protein